MTSILFSFLILAGLGIILGIGLSIADKKLKVVKDDRLVKLEENMPGANCGGCGYAGCSAYAEAVFKGEAQPGLCSPGGQKLADIMGQILGVEVVAKEKEVAYVFCKGGCGRTTKKYDYYGLKDCNAAAMLFSGDNNCKAGCLHLGSCISVCEQNAISKNDEGDIVVDGNLCIGCGQCTKVCPNGVIKLIPADATYAVKCNSHENGATVRKACSAGCIGCKICETKFPESGFKVDQFLSCHDYKNHGEETQKAANACPRKVIEKVR